MTTALNVLGAIFATLLLSGCAAPHVQPSAQVKLLVISDIDDTIKDTRVTLSRNTHLKNPLMLLDFLRNWKPVPGMSQVYRNWAAEEGASFAYVSGGPPFYQGRIKRFLERNEFPDGPVFLNPTFPLRTWRHKARSISGLMTAYSKAQVVLIGDSGEHDAAIYGQLQAQHPGRVTHILIREVTEDAPEIVLKESQWKQTSTRWSTFKQASELPKPKLSPATVPRTKSILRSESSVEMRRAKSTGCVQTELLSPWGTAVNHPTSANQRHDRMELPRLLTTPASTRPR